MTNDDMTCETHKQIVKPLSQTCDHFWRASVRSGIKCACVRTVRCCLYRSRNTNNLNSNLRPHRICNHSRRHKPSCIHYHPDQWSSLRGITPGHNNEGLPPCSVTRCVFRRKRHLCCCHEATSFHPRTPAYSKTQYCPSARTSLPQSARRGETPTRAVPPLVLHESHHVVHPITDKRTDKTPSRCFLHGPCTPRHTPNNEKLVEANMVEEYHSSIKTKRKPLHHLSDFYTTGKKPPLSRRPRQVENQHKCL